MHTIPQPFQMPTFSADSDRFRVVDHRGFTACHRTEATAREDYRLSIELLAFALDDEGHEDADLIASLRAEVARLEADEALIAA